ncbi:hypothetical protein [Pseudomonas sp. TH10]|uniref:hypothetical protein n=1 Tax=Pseudomonas sp. TH10 TaxID=2796376 RepID=UPI00191397BC|nr:hypothetical protein [Pseudomonas sp. TH10]MBK5519367.1 hypothetical protein [Pseudomonas sp. TH10]MCA4961713.1 hypothetical protein [Pseudomonas sp. Y24-6]
MLQRSDSRKDYVTPKALFKPENSTATPQPPLRNENFTKSAVFYALHLAHGAAHPKILGYL